MKPCSGRRVERLSTRSREPRGVVAVSKRPDAQILKRLDENGPERAIAAPVWHELVHGLVLVTTNDHDFVRFKGVRVENWSKRHVRQKTEPT